jgi:hypothetical protein
MATYRTKHLQQRNFFSVENNVLTDLRLLEVVAVVYKQSQS